VLRALEVRDLVIIERASLELGGGFTVLTGETGAGKSLLVDAIELLVGARGDGGVVREGAERAELSAEFELASDAALLAWLEESDLAGDPGQLILRRTIERSGRSRCFINGHAATLAQLRQAGELLVDIHGQHAHQSLLRAAAQRALLDAHAGCEALARDTAQAFRDWRPRKASPRARPSAPSCRTASRSSSGSRRARTNGQSCRPCIRAWRTARACSPAPSPRWRPWWKPKARRCRSSPRSPAACARCRRTTPD
jgi:DNA repair protein RecN (Recombination protein N)